MRTNTRPKCGRSSLHSDFPFLINTPTLGEARFASSKSHTTSDEVRIPERIEVGAEKLSKTSKPNLAQFAEIDSLVYCLDGFAGWDPKHRIKVGGADRVVRRPGTDWRCSDNDI